MADLPICQGMTHKFLLIDLNPSNEPNSLKGYLFNRERTLRFYLHLISASTSIVKQITPNNFVLEISTGKVVFQDKKHYFYTLAYDASVGKQLLSITFKDRAILNFKIKIRSCPKHYFFPSQGPDIHQAILAKWKVTIHKLFTNPNSRGLYWDKKFNLLQNLVRSVGLFVKGYTNLLVLMIIVLVPVMGLLGFKIFRKIDVN
jgi:hypothetical protein